MIAVTPLAKAELSLLEQLPFARPETHRRRFDMQQHGDLVFLVAWQATLPLGQALLIWEGGDRAAVIPRKIGPPEIASVFVAPLHRRKGVATRLLNTAEAVAKARGFSQICISVSIFNTPARTLYRKLQYADAGYGEYLARGIYTDPQGRQRTWEETRVYLIKDL